MQPFILKKFIEQCHKLCSNLEFDLRSCISGNYEVNKGNALVTLYNQGNATVNVDLPKKITHRFTYDMSDFLMAKKQDIAKAIALLRVREIAIRDAIEYVRLHDKETERKILLAQDAETMTDIFVYHLAMLRNIVTDLQHKYDGIEISRKF